LREERRQRAFESRVLRRIFGPKRGEVKGKWGKVHIVGSFVFSTAHQMLLG